MLVGVGHANAHVVRAWGLAPLPQTRLVAISPFDDATYSGLLPGVLAGQYPPDAMRIALRRLCDSAGVEFVAGEAAHCDRARRELILTSGERVEYDFVSIGAGSHARWTGEEPMPSSVVPIKPMQTFLERLAAQLAAVEATHAGENRPTADLVVVGGGAGGTEIAFCVRPWLERCAPGVAWRIALIGGDELPAPSLGRAAGRRLIKELRSRGIHFEGRRRVARVVEDHLEYADGERRRAEVVIWSTDAVAPEWFERLDLPRDARGFLLTKPTLETLDDPRIFAVGDSGTLAEHPLPKAGVYAVRQGPFVWENLRRAREGRPLIPFRPQRRFLKLLNLGDGRGLGEYAGWTFAGRWVWRWKDRIDSRFMALYQR